MYIYIYISYTYTYPSNFSYTFENQSILESTGALRAPLILLPTYSPFPVKVSACLFHMRNSVFVSARRT